MKDVRLARITLAAAIIVFGAAISGAQENPAHHGTKGTPGQQFAAMHEHAEATAHATTGAASISISVTPSGGLAVGQKADFTMALRTSAGKPVLLDDLKEMHESRIHLLIVDPSLTDFHHEHTMPGAAPGTYTFTITPRKAGEYKVFASLFPRATDTHEYPATTFTVEGTATSVEKTVNKTTTVDGYRFDLKFEEETFSAGHPHMAWVTVAGPDGRSFDQLEPVMGDFAHIVVFSEDRKEIAHIHPMGKKPGTVDERGGPTVEFQTDFATGGYKKLFLQVQIGGRSILAPFGLEVNPGKGDKASAGHEHAEGHEKTHPETAEQTPDTVDALLGEVSERVAELDRVVGSGRLEDVHEIAFAIRDMLVALSSQAKNLSPENQNALAASLARIKQQAALLDKFGDAGDAGQTRAVLVKFKAEIDAIGKLVSAKESSDAGANGGIKMAGNRICPISGHPAGSMEEGAHVDYKGYRVGLCCMGCKEDFLAAADRNLAKALGE